jgi:hypothetical protein
LLQYSSQLASLVSCGPLLKNPKTTQGQQHLQSSSKFKIPQQSPKKHHLTMSKQQLNQINSWSEYLIHEDARNDLHNNNNNNNDTKTKRRHNPRSGNNKNDNDNETFNDCTDTIEESIQNVVSRSHSHSRSHHPSSNSSTKRNINALYETVSLNESLGTGTDENENDRPDRHDDRYSNGKEFKLQWMRPHPSLFFQLASELNPSSDANKDADIEDLESSKNDSDGGRNKKSKNRKGERRKDTISQSCIISTKASRIVNQHHKHKILAERKENGKRKQGNAKVKNISTNRFHNNNHHHNNSNNKNEKADEKKLMEYAESFIQYPTLQIDLTQLINPQLMSQWVPGSSAMNITSATTTSSYDDHQTIQSSHTIPTSLDKDTNNDKGMNLKDDNIFKHNKLLYEKSINSIIEFAITFSKQTHITSTQQDKGRKNTMTSLNEYSNTLNKTMRSQNILHQKTIDNLKQLTQELWIQTLPSHVLIQKMKEYHGSSQKITLTTILLVLITLVSLCHSQSVGIYSLKILCPSLFYTCKNKNSHNYGSTNTNNDESDANDDNNELTDEENTAIKVLAMLIVNKCELGELSKKDLRNYMKQDNDMNGPNSALDELNICISSAYYCY